MLRQYLKRRRRPTEAPAPPAGVPALSECYRMQRAVIALHAANEQLTTRLASVEERAAWEAAVTLYLDERTADTDERLATLALRLDDRLSALEHRIDDQELARAGLAELSDLMELRSSQAKLATEVARLSIDLRHEVTRVATHVGVTPKGPARPAGTSPAPLPAPAPQDADRWAVATTRAAQSA